ncbi:hypothetical protein NIES2101_06145 [Calothrix sp. HK-06]|nr:hypothetical protein NIES2101_06145 [Calothrix sp. HK-06]
MTQINYDGISDQQLKQYFLRNREDKLALQAYLDRLSTREGKVIATANDPDFEAKLKRQLRKKCE